MITLSEFLRKEFNISGFPEENNKIVEDFRVEKIKKNLCKKIGKSSKLNNVLESKLAKKKNRLDIDDEIEAKWNKSFKKIKNELLNIDEVLNTDRASVVEKKVRLKVEKRQKKDEHYLMLDYTWFVKLSAACVIVLMFAVSTTTFAPDFANTLTTAVNSAFDFNTNPNNSIEKKDNAHYIARRATISKNAMSEYIVNNREKLKDLNDGDVVNANLGIENNRGRVAGASSKYSEDDKQGNMFLLFLKKLIKID